MARSSSKHANAQIITLNDFSGGLNYIVSPEAMADNQLQQADNFEYDPTTGKLRVAAGFIRKYQSPSGDIQDLWYDAAHDVLLYRVGNQLFYSGFEFTGEINIGTLSGESPCMFTTFGHDTYSASGGPLQKWTGPGGSFTTITADKPGGGILLADIVFTRYGRIAIMKAGDDYLFESGIGDATNWNFIGTNTSDAKRLEVGYMDSGNIIGYAPIAQDLIVFKDNMRVYRITGEYSSDPASTWSCLPYSENLSCANTKCSVQAGNDVYVFGKGGFINLSTVTEYGSIKQAEAGKLVNPTLISVLNMDTARIYRVNSRQQIWIQPNYYSDFVYIYHYSTGAFTCRRFYTGKFGGITEKGNQCYVAIGNRICLLDEKTATEDGVSVRPIMRTKKWRSSREYLIKQVKIDTYNIAAGSGLVSIGDASVPVTTSNPSIDIYGDTGDIYGDMGDIYEDSVVSPISIRRNYRTKSFDILLQMDSGGIGINGINLQVAEVGA